MPGLGRYPCTSCHYVAGNRRMLARHAVLIHSEKVFKCPLCPFITRYAANWYRHKRDLHGLNKITTCEACGFFANSTAELAQHIEAEHPELLQLEKYEDKYAKEKARLGAEEPIQDDIVPEVTLVEEEVTSLQPDEKDVYDINNYVEEIICPEEKTTNADSVTFSLPSLGLPGADGTTVSSNGVNEVSPQSVAMTDSVSSPDKLRPLKVKRSYNCSDCGLLTSNPREYLYHLQNIHGEKINIHECKYCIYASKHIQKLTRHIKLVHRQLIAKDPEYLKELEASKEKKSKSSMITLGMHFSSNSESYKNSANASKRNLQRNKGLLKCSLCAYHTRNRSLMFHHEKTAHLKKRFYRCLQCGYVTNERGRYTKHIKYHSLPKMQCEFCFFKTPYKWNMDRHMKNHEVGAEGEFRCTTCNFTTSTKQSFKSHVTNHHDPTADDECFEQEDELSNPNESSEWEDIDYFQGEEESILPLDEVESNEPYDFPSSRENADMVWKDGKVYQKTLKCRTCDFRAAWPFELKKHEETHKSQKKHPCPLCGMRFEHIAWLTKHLRRVHREDSEARNIAAAFDLLKPSRRRPGKEYASDTVLPMFQEVLKQNNSSSNKPPPPPESNKNSMLSSLLKKPLQPFMPPAVNKFNSSYKQKNFGVPPGSSSSNSNNSSMSRQLRMTHYFDRASSGDASESSKSKVVPTCSVCGYKTRWISELQRHMRVHSQEKPFHCHKCKYHCKWKGDLNRHLMKYHGIKMPTSSTKKYGIPKLKLKKSSSVDPVSDWQVNQEAKRNQLRASAPVRNSDQDSPLDLTLTKETFPHPYPQNDVYDPYDIENLSSGLGSEEPIDVETVDSYSSFRQQPLQHMREPSPNGGEESPGGLKRKYQCPFCTFGTTTASRFHVHIVQHYNRRPFMCSVCGYNSNWEWDITKHIRLKGCRDKSHNKACVLLTDETGRRNYEKYEKYLVDIDKPKPLPSNSLPIITEVSSLSESSEPRFNTNRPNFTEPPAKNCSYDFRNIGSNFEEAPVNIVVTPDINLPDETEIMERSDEYVFDNQPPEDLEKLSDSTKLFYCKHCNFKHSTKRVVVSHLSIHAGLKPFRCRACGISSNWRHVIVRHVKDAHNGYMNEVEDRINYVQEGYALRLTSVNSGTKENGSAGKSAQQFGCKICPYKCDKEFYIKFHMKQHRPREGAIYRCDFCPYFVKFKKTLVRHMKLHNPPSVETVPVDDNQVLMDTNGYDNTAHSEVNPYQNDVYEFYDQGNDSADDSIPISFDKLNQYTDVEPVSPPKIKRHICENCPYKTDNKTQYLYHKQFHRPNPSAPFKCTVCSYWATMQHLLTQHMKVHSENESEQDHQKESTRSRRSSPEKSPDVIETEVPEKMSVIYVKRGDLIVKMFKCQYCPMMNKKKANVRVHQKMHGVIVNDGKFACTYCNYQCLNQGGLTNHIKVHQKVPEKQAYPQQNTPTPDKKSSLDANGENVPQKGKKVFSYCCKKCPAVFKNGNDLENHKKFHGSSFPFPCTHCDYRARHKPHLFKHLLVHTPEYGLKRNASQAPLASVENKNASEFLDPSEATKIVSGPKKIDQMLLLEASEVKAAMKKVGNAASNLQKCGFCPAAFFKTSTLSYHISLHGSDGEFKCSQCDYAVSRPSNLSNHSQVHPKKTPPKRTLRTFPCPKCPAIFYKLDRFERHSNLHGGNYKFACDQCDYSVRFAANLFKHKALHAAKKDTENADSVKSPTGSNNNFNSVSQLSKPLTENTNILETEEKRTTFICDRCPYFQTRKDAVQSHQRRHWLQDGFKCPYCDYSSMQNSFLQNHLKMHIQPHQLFPAQAFMKYQTFKIWCMEDGKETLLFDDEQINSNEQSSEEKQSCSEESNEEVEQRCKKQKTTKVSYEPLENDYSISQSPLATANNPKVPVVVLSDIFANDKDMKKWAPKLKIPKLKISKCSDILSNSSTSSKKYSKFSSDSLNDDEKSQSSSKSHSKPSLVVKIRVENCLVNMHEKTMYSVTSSEAAEPAEQSKVENVVGSTENTNDSTSDIIFRDSDPSLNAIAVRSPVPGDIEDCTLTSSSELDDSMKVTDDSVEVEDLMDSIVGPSTDTEELIISQPANEICDLKSDESYSNDTVPVVIRDILCDKLSDLNDLSFKDNISLTNGDRATHLANGLAMLTEEIQVEL
ncbi:uncharacterized protein LOC118184439 [Stegodyphus dumicola]|uniref:uncharacterized protein LOC118184439 n=1 Tax=Stegodyphus dumicola TaxID=202533 RepID=UPI0015A90279|nr:uncharacterized protein LOC118184439 [Stegodyphus dumicola]